MGQWLGGWFLVFGFFFFLKTEGRRMIRCFCLHLHFLCFFFYFMLICQLVIGGQKDGGYCHHRIEVILFHIISISQNFS